MLQNCGNLMQAAQQAHAEQLQWPTRSPAPAELNGCYFSFQESFLQLWRLTTHYLSHSAYITVCLISAGNKVPIWFPNWESGQKRWDIFVATHKGKDTNFFFLLLLKGLIWSSWDTKFTSGIRSWGKKEKTGIKNNFASKAVKQQLLIVWTWLFH